ncbi:RDD family protein [Chryseolinea lacunae]|uniref:RDD family protein n=1 Tax=Chryseolinea lacunae TaxID=2801331 RepID=A0ABS1L187_9BACT|nr:RDD family protein [Chryseolinea lacunae]MBL0745469.1 RDD family protein [Chryseolinea lacunae]
MKQGKTILLLLTAIFFSTEGILIYMVSSVYNGDVFGAGFKTCFFLLLILLFSKKLAWAKWILSVLLIVYGALMLLAGTEHIVLYAIGAFDIFFGFYIHKSKALAIFRSNQRNDEEAPMQAETIIDTPAEEKHAFEYPQLVRRYKALFIDFMLVFTTLIIIMLLVQDSELRTPIMVTSAAIICLTYEPVLTTYSRTLGQKLMRIRVGRNENPLEKISLLNAYARWGTKWLLGWISFVTIHFNPEKRAIHDLASDSVMTIEE